MSKKMMREPECSGRADRFLGPMPTFVLWGALLLAPTAAHGTRTDTNIKPYENIEFTGVWIAGPFEFPSSIAFLPDNSILVAERPGRVQIIRPGSPARQLTGVPPVLYAGHAGLLDIALDPDFANSGIVYLSYAHGTDAFSVVRLTRARLDLQTATLEDPQVIFESAPPATRPELLGGRMAITSDGHLFLTLGDRREPRSAQDLSDHAGSIIRIRTDGSVPEDNPFTFQPGVRPEIWSYGHRNPQGLALDPGTDRLWSHEHGPKGGDELNLIIRGGNYGWPVISHGTDYSGAPIGEGTAKEGMLQPIHHWTPAIAPSGLAIESTVTFTRLWISTLVGQSLLRLELDDGRIVRERYLLQGEFGRIRDVRVGLDGLAYFVTDHAPGALYRLERVIERAERESPEGAFSSPSELSRVRSSCRSRRTVGSRGNVVRQGLRATCS